MSDLASRYLSEVISYGGLPLRRADVFAVCLADHGRAAADLFAFGPNRRRLDCDPLTVAEYRRELADLESRSIQARLTLYEKRA